MALRTLSRAPLVALALLAAAPGLRAQAAPPSPAQVLGYELGERFTPYSGVQQYSRALADASPVVEYRPYGRTYEGRELFQLVIASPENLRRMDAILAANAELARAGTTPERARQVAAENPAVVYFSYGVHGNESSSSEAALYTAWDLARDAAEVRGVLGSLVVIIDPVANPDGRDRYVQWFGQAVGAVPNPNPASREHREVWPGGRFNHYLFDLNRDWSWATQVETKARLATWFRYNPQVHVDFHEMDYNSSYFFFPAAAPINPIYPQHILQWGRRFGEGNARVFDQNGWAYFTGEAFDLFYPGYGDSWPSLVGAVGMTYEQAGHGSAGLSVVQTSGDTLTLRDRATHHRAAGQATLRTAAAGKAQLLADYAAAARTAGQGERDFLLVPGTDGSRVEALVSHLRRQGIEVERATQAFRAGATPLAGFPARGDFPAGTYRVRARQGLGRLAITLLQQETPLRAGYSYDVSAWSLPYAYGVATYRGTAGGQGWAAVPATTDEAVPGTAPAATGYGYLVAPGAETARGIVRLLRTGARVRVLGKASAFAGRRYPAGTWFLPVRGNDSLRARIARAGLGAAAVPITSGLSEGGIDLGSESIANVRLPRVAVLTGEGVQATSYGAHWFFLEQQLGMPFDALPIGDVGSADLADYQVIVVPAASERALKSVTDPLKAWVQRGGRLVAVGSGAEALAAMAEVKVREGAKADSGRARFLAGREERERQEWRQEVPGTILPVRLDPAHPLAFGAGLDGRPDETFTLHIGTAVFEPAAGLETVAYIPQNPQRISGVVSPENLRQLGQGAVVASKRMGQGSVVLFADDPLFRAFWRSMQPLYVNALLIGP